MARMQIPTETSTWLLQAKDFLYQARRLKPGPERNDLRQTAKVLREIARLEAASEQAPGRDWRQRESAVSSGMPQRQVTMRKVEQLRKRAHMAPPD
jgi:hypothetical protein